jgi:hypothetical protein
MKDELSSTIFGFISGIVIYYIITSFYNGDTIHAPDSNIVRYKLFYDVNDKKNYYLKPQICICPPSFKYKKH